MNRHASCKQCGTFEKAESANTLPFAVSFHVGAYFCMGAYKHNVVVIKMGAYIHGCLFRFYGAVSIAATFASVYLHL